MAWAAITLVAGLVFQLTSVHDGLSWSLEYFTAPAAVLPFAVGAVLYFLRRRNVWTASPRLAAGAFAAWLANMLAGGALLPPSHVFGIGYFLDTLCFAIVVSGLDGLSKQRFGAVVERIDRTLGEWSYFAFLVHWLCGFVVVTTLSGVDRRGWILLLAVTPLVLAACAGFAALNRKCLEPLRDRVRGRPGGFARRLSTALAGAPPR